MLSEIKSELRFLGRAIFFILILSIMFWGGWMLSIPSLGGPSLNLLEAFGFVLMGCVPGGIYRGVKK